MFIKVATFIVVTHSNDLTKNFINFFSQRNFGVSFLDQSRDALRPGCVWEILFLYMLYTQEFYIDAHVLRNIGEPGKYLDSVKKDNASIEAIPLRMII